LNCLAVEQKTRSPHVRVLKKPCCHNPAVPL
jgi:hypothetical protein